MPANAAYNHSIALNLVMAAALGGSGSESFLTTQGSCSY